MPCHVGQFSIVSLILLLVLNPVLATGQTTQTRQGNQATTTIDAQKSGGERELKGGEKHTYPFQLKTNDYLKLVVEQRGVDVVVRLIGPDGKTLHEVDSPNGTQGPEPLSAIIEQGGSYTVEVESLEKTAPSGKYELKVESVKPATEQDRVRFEIEKLGAEVETLRQAGKYDQALSLAQQVLDKAEKVFGSEHILVAGSLDTLGLILKDKGNYTKAEPLFMKALAIYEKVDPNHPDIIFPLNNLGMLFYYKGEYSQAESLMVRVLAISEKAGKDSEDVASSLNNLAFLYNKKGDHARAEPLYVRALAIWEKVLGAEHPKVAIGLNNLAGIYYMKGDYVRAESLYIKVLAIREKVLGPEHLETAHILNNLAQVYQNKGEYAKAESLYVKALAIMEKILGPEHPGVAQSLNNLAVHYQVRGDYARAEPLYLRALAIREKSLGAEHPETADSLINLAVLYADENDYTRAEPLYLRALTIYEKVLGVEHPYVANTLNNLAKLYYNKGEYPRAEPLYVRALKIWEKALGAVNLDTAKSLANLGELYSTEGNYAQAESLLMRALAIREKIVGIEHPDVASILNSLARLYQAKGETTQAIRYRTRGNDTTERDLVRNLVVGSELQKALYLKQTTTDTDQTISLHVQTAPGDPAAIQAALNIILRRKGRALDAMTSALGNLRNRQNPEVQKLLNDYANLVGQLSVLTLRGPGTKKPEDHLADIQSLEDQKEKLENEISRQSGEFKAQTTPITLEAVQKLIPTNAALVEYAVYRPFDAKANRFGKPRYVAYVLQGIGTEKQGSGFRVPGSGSEKQGSGFRGQGSGSEIREVQPYHGASSFTSPNSKGKDNLQKAEPGTRNPEPGTLALKPGTLSWVDLGDAEPIDKVAESLRQALSNPKKHPIQEVQSMSQALDQLVMRPVRKLVGSTRHLLISPDGALNLIPFSALVDEKGKFLVENYTLTYLTSGRDLLRLDVKIESQDPPLVIADPDYADGAGPKVSGGTFHRLAQLLGTRKEGQEIKAMFPDAHLIMKSAATETVLKQAVKPKIVHIATHGYFLEDQPQAGTTDDSTQSRQAQAELSKDYEKQRELNPLLRSMLFFAGANQGGSGDNDGVMTALEAAQLNLWGTKLVVLSACDTGLGDVKNGDGVYGLRRALVLAGSEAQMMSLWAVSDQATRELMTEYYTRLKAGEGRSEALRHTQLKLLKDPKRQHP
ncbi:MAG TPA: tetratricopeptide repeat protein, partial [Acidobacteriota bacterium]|nr:tetratricopeptide repeat protein [Acidobacteriota bacterium]